MPLHLKSDALARYVATGEIDELAPPRRKYYAKPAIVDGIRFDSTKESRRYVELRILARAGVIRHLELQPRFMIDVSGPAGIVHCGVYTADFRYVDATTGRVVIEDVKSKPTRTTAYRLRKRIVEALHGITIREV